MRHAAESGSQRRQGALKTTTATVKGDHNGWPFTLRKSQLANWKPKGKGPYTVGVLFDGLSNPFQAYVFNSLQKFLKRSVVVDKVIAVVSEVGTPRRTSRTTSRSSSRAQT